MAEPKSESFNVSLAELNQFVADLISEEDGEPITYNTNHPFGGLRPVKNPQTPQVYSETCYICNDPDFRTYGLPLCYPCQKCGGHIAADETTCDACGFDVHDTEEAKP